MKKLFPFLFLFCSYSYIYASYPQGYYETLEGKTGAVLKTALHKIICQDTTSYLKYGSGIGRTWQGFYSTDKNEINNSIVDMYSSEIVYFPANYIELGYKGFGNTVQIEHCVPKSWWKCDITHADCAARDLNHLYPANGSMNGSKSNHPLGVVSGKITKDNGVSKVGAAVYDDYVGSVFEPADQYKGDFARSYFYVATAYEHYVKKWDTTLAGNMMQPNTYPTLKTWAVNLLLQWHRQDPVSEKEQKRVEKVFEIQRNRNPFIDYPELIEHIWGDKVGTAWKLPTSVSENTNNSVKLIVDSTQKSVFIQAETISPVNICIFSIDGKMICQEKNMSNSTISLAQLTKGVYIIKILLNNQMITEKIIL